MVELNEKTQQDFLNREWVQKLLDAGVDMSDAYYGIARDTTHGNRDKIFFIHMWGLEDTKSFTNKIPTYTVSELLYKLHDCIYLTIDDMKNPIEFLASLLIQCHKKDIGIKTKDTENINNK